MAYTYNRNYNQIDRIYEDGTIEWAAIYDGRFSALHAMELFVCGKYHWNFFDVRMREKAREHIKIGKTKRTCSFEYNGETYSILALRNKKDVFDGVSTSEFDFESKTIE